jgi:N-acetyl-anhydromuramyl-L-alanine amidase AmpD
MKITRCLLDTSNNMAAAGAALSSYIRGQGKEHLWEERSPDPIDVIVIHYTSAVNLDPVHPFDLGLILRIFCDFGVSSHYLVERRGRVFQLVPEDKKAWHAGGSIMPLPDGRKMVNSFSIGIELVATPDSGFTKRQYASCARLCRDIERRHGTTFTYVGHEDIAGEAAVELGLRNNVKSDPGPLFDWKLFRSMLRSPASSRTKRRRGACRHPG